MGGNHEIRAWEAWAGGARMTMVRTWTKARALIMRSHAGLIIRHREAQQGFTEHPVVAE